MTDTNVSYYHHFYILFEVEDDVNILTRNKTENNKNSLGDAYLPTQEARPRGRRGVLDGMC